MTPRPPDWDRLLLAYADGELGPEACAAVERRIAEDDSAADLLADLAETSPLSDLWECVPIPEPTEDDWRRTSQAIAALSMRRRRRWPMAVAAGLAFSVAVGLALLAWPPAPEPAAPMARNEPVPPSPDPLPEVAVRPVAPPDDKAVPTDPTGGEPAQAAEKPTTGIALALNTPTDEEADEDVSWNGDGEMVLRPKK